MTQDKPEGVHCRECWCTHCPTQFTYRKGRFTFRRRRCRHCGNEFDVREEICNEAPPKRPRAGDPTQGLS